MRESILGGLYRDYISIFPIITSKPELCSCLANEGNSQAPTGQRLTGEAWSILCCWGVGLLGFQCLRVSEVPEIGFLGLEALTLLGFGVESGSGLSVRE